MSLVIETHHDLLWHGSGRRITCPERSALETRQVDKRPIKRTTWLFVTMVIALFMCCGGVAFFWQRPLNGIRVDQLEADLNQSLPDGSTWEQAEAWFASHGFKTKTIGEKDGPITGLGASIPNDDLLDSATIHIQLHFNAEKRLEKRVIYRFIMSL
jgi:hypothetical protein